MEEPKAPLPLPALIEVWGLEGRKSMGRMIECVNKRKESKGMDGKNLSEYGRAERVDPRGEE